MNSEAGLEGEQPLVNEIQRRKWSCRVFTLRCAITSLLILCSLAVPAIVIIIGASSGVATVWPVNENLQVVLGQLDSRVLELSTYRFESVEVHVKARSFGNVSLGMMSKSGKKASKTFVSCSNRETLGFVNGATYGYQVSAPMFIRGSLGQLNITADFNSTVQMTVLEGFQDLSDWIENNEFPSVAPPAVFKATGSSFQASINIWYSNFYYIVWSGAPLSQKGDAFEGSSVVSYSYQYHQLPSNKSTTIACTINQTCTLEVSKGENFLLINSGPLPGNMTDIVRVTSIANKRKFFLTFWLPVIFISCVLGIFFYVKHRPSFGCMYPDYEYEVIEIEPTESSSILSKAKGVIHQLT